MLSIVCFSYFFKKPLFVPIQPSVWQMLLFLSFESNSTRTYGAPNIRKLLPHCHKYFSNLFPSFTPATWRTGRVFSDNEAWRIAILQELQGSSHLGLNSVRTMMPTRLNSLNNVHQNKVKNWVWNKKKTHSIITYWVTRWAQVVAPQEFLLSFSFVTGKSWYLTSKLRLDLYVAFLFCINVAVEQIASSRVSS